MVYPLCGSCALEFIEDSTCPTCMEKARVSGVIKIRKKMGGVKRRGLGVVSLNFLHLRSTVRLSSRII